MGRSKVDPLVEEVIEDVGLGRILRGDFLSRDFMPYIFGLQRKLNPNRSMPFPIANPKIDIKEVQPALAQFINVVPVFEKGPVAFNKIRDVYGNSGKATYHLRKLVDTGLIAPTARPPDARFRESSFYALTDLGSHMAIELQDPALREAVVSLNHSVRPAQALKFLSEQAGPVSFTRLKSIDEPPVPSGSLVYLLEATGTLIDKTPRGYEMSPLGTALWTVYSAVASQEPSFLSADVANRSAY